MRSPDAIARELRMHGFGGVADRVQEQRGGVRDYLTKWFGPDRIRYNRDGDLILWLKRDDGRWAQIPL